MRILALLLLSSLAFSCSRPEGPAEPESRAPRVVPEETPPTGTLATIALGDPGSFLEGAASLFESRFLRAFVPKSTAGILRVATGLPPSISKSVPVDAPLAGLVLEDDGRRVTVFAVRLDDLASGVAPLGGGVEALPGAPAKGLWVRDSSAESQPEMALVGDLLFVSESRDGIERAHRHLAHRLLEKGDGTLRITFHAEAFARHSRPILEQGARAVADETLERVREAREEKGRAPELGDPEAIVEWLRDETLEIASFLPDLEDARASVRFEGGVGLVDLTIVAREGTPLEGKLKGAPAPREGRVRGLMRAIPEGAALGVVVAEGEPLAGALKVISAERLNEGDRARLDSIFAGEAPRALVFGGDREGGFVWLARAESGDHSWVAEALAIPHVRTVLAALAGCDAPSRAPRFDKASRAALCATAETRATVTAAVREETSSLSLTTTTTSGTREAPLESARTDAHPDAARAIGALGDEVSLALYLEGSRVIPTLSLRSDFHELRTLTTALAPRPIVVGVGTRGREGSVRATFSPGSIDRFFALVGEARRILAGR